jgi:hypothetical protein
MHHLIWMRARFTPILSALLAVAAAAALAAEVTTNYNRQVNFGNYETYSWIGVRAGNELWQDRIQRAVDTALAAKGWMKVLSSGQASVAAFGRTREQDTLHAFYDGFPGWDWQRTLGSTGARPTAIGTLTIDIFDSGDKQLIWRGVATGTLTANPEKNGRGLDNAVKEMFRKFRSG